MFCGGAGLRRGGSPPLSPSRGERYVESLAFGLGCAFPRGAGFPRLLRRRGGRAAQPRLWRGGGRRPLAEGGAGRLMGDGGPGLRSVSGRNACSPVSGCRRVTSARLGWVLTVKSFYNRRR